MASFLTPGRSYSPFSRETDWSQWRSHYMRYMKNVSHLVLCGSCTWALYALRDEGILSSAPYYAMLSHGIVGSLRYSHSFFDNRVVNYTHDVTKRIARMGLLPLINSQIALEILDDPHIAGLFGCLYVIPLLTHPILKTHEYSDYVYDLVALAGEIYLGCMSTIEDRIGWSLMVEGDFLNRFFVTNLCRRLSVPSEEFYTLGLAVLCFLGPFFMKNIRIGDVISLTALNGK
uniref:Uncharacterized protein n=1 Tax=Nyssomyia neivai TaxID=330878 RepID=A0A1L8D8M7_9DIPT